MKIIYMGTPDFAVGPLEALLAGGHEVVCVLTQADKPKGRGHQLQAPPVKEAALKAGIPVLQPLKMKDPALWETLRGYGADLFVVVAYGMSGWRSFLALMRNPKSDITVLILTFLLTIVFDLTVAIEVGLLCACLLFMRRMAETTDVRVISDEIDLNEDADMERGNLEHLTIPENVEVYEINGPYFFGAGNRFEDIMARYGNRPKVRIIRMRKVPFIDSTGLHNLENLCLMSQKEGITIVLSGVVPKVEQVLKNNGFNQLLGEENICNHIDLALARAREIVE